MEQLNCVRGQPLWWPMVILSGLVAGLITGCHSISQSTPVSSPRDHAIDHIVIHATSENFQESMRLLSGGKQSGVSAHYVIPAAQDPTYPDETLRIQQVVEEERAAWHAGPSYWAGQDRLNRRAIGIELVNEFDCTTPSESIDLAVDQSDFCDFRPYDNEQIDLLLGLLTELVVRYPGINPINIVAHSDVALRRRSDPGALFPWLRLYEAGFGAWPDPEVTERYRQRFSTQMPSVRQAQRALGSLGYEVKITGVLDDQTQLAMRAFQLHFRPQDYSGHIDVESMARLWALLEGYRSTPQFDASCILDSRC